MAQDFHHIYQFKIILENFPAQVSRKIQVPETYTFWELHVAIQCAMGWKFEKPHVFEARNPKTQCYDRLGIPETKNDLLTQPSWQIPLKAYFSQPKQEGIYEYGSDDSWVHQILFQRVRPREVDISYPRCISGKNSCPPEEWGGPRGYEQSLQTTNPPQAATYENRTGRLAKKLKLSPFQGEKVTFEDPEQRLKVVCGQ